MNNQLLHMNVPSLGFSHSYSLHGNYYSTITGKNEVYVLIGRSTSISELIIKWSNKLKWFRGFVQRDVKGSLMVNESVD